MKIRGDLKVLRDLIVKTSVAVPEVGQALIAASVTGRVAWSDIRVYVVDPLKTYAKGTFVTLDLYDELFMARADLSNGGDVYNTDEWLAVNSESGTSAGGVVEYDSFDTFPAVGAKNTIYIDALLGSLYRWNSTEVEYSNVGGGISRDVTASITVGGIGATNVVPAGTDLRAFMEKLLNPEVLAKLVSPFLGYAFNLNLNAKEMIGSIHLLDYTNVYEPGKIQGYDIAGDASLIDQKGAATIVNVPSSGTQHIITEANIFKGDAAYAAGTEDIYSSEGKIDTSIDRIEGVFPTRTLSIDGYYNVYMGVTNKTRAQVVTDLVNGTIPPDSYSYPYILDEDFTVGGDKLAKKNVSLFLLLPKGKFTKSRIVTIYNDVPIQTFDLDDFGGISVTDVIIAHGNVNLTYSLYFRHKFGGWTSDMEIKEFKINNL